MEEKLNSKKFNPLIIKNDIIDSEEYIRKNTLDYISLGYGVNGFSENGEELTLRHIPNTKIGSKEELNNFLKNTYEDRVISWFLDIMDNKKLKESTRQELQEAIKSKKEENKNSHFLIKQKSIGGDSGGVFAIKDKKTNQLIHLGIAIQASRDETLYVKTSAIKDDILKIIKERQ